MDLTPYVSALRDDLAAAASVGDEQTAKAGTALAAALEPAVRLALMNALSDLASEVSDSLDDHSVSLRLRGREVDVVVDRTAPDGESGGFYAGPTSSPFAGAGASRPGFVTPPGPPGPGAGPADMGDISRMTLRLVDQIKGQAEQAAAAQGMSLNSWISQAVQGALRDSWGHGKFRGHDWSRGQHWGRGWDEGPDAGSDDSPGSGDRPSGDRPSDERPSGDDGEGGSGVSGWVRG
ncbi:toxin-antitoxin system HicB family antitoxin [Actinomycetospora sp. TBRC 11914]|uniref:toxin-antitoxin system HicB family antitoxin n=1 Tax=Actinomycetospora sp. TBRC 11914 TaxID=2729387 RepID=UPI00145C5F93|nr:toxin-antitoxin system HicB family antitoxin [Actinomycetospora sp. TBRC 11914]NMO89918.1 toxin-antitoxin system HicB family antitoxin [Actinomycetospora sp. TBRC 11914]